MVFKVRFGIRRPDGYTSSIWTLFSSKDKSIYVSSRKLGGVNKLSFHQSGICRYAFTREHIEKYGPIAGMDDRVMIKWRRMETPMARTRRAASVLIAAFPTNYLSYSTEKIEKKVKWIDAAAVDRATFVEISYTRQTELAVRRELKKGGYRNLVGYFKLKRNEATIVTYYYDDWENKDLNFPKGPGSTMPDLMFSSNDPAQTGRPFRLVLHSNPNDGDALLLQELGGYAAQ